MCCVSHALVAAIWHFTQPKSAEKPDSNFKVQKWTFVNSCVVGSFHRNILT